MPSTVRTLKLSATLSVKRLLSKLLFQTTHSIKYGAGIMVIAALQNSAFAASIPDFTAKFNVYAIGLKLGESNHTLRCQQSDCTLQAVSKPQGLAKILLNESSEETIKLKQTESEFIWQSYIKRYGKDLNNPKTLKTRHFFISEQPPQKVINPATKKSWPLQTQIYDSISLAYAVQFNVLNERPLNNFHLQDRKRQESLILKGAFTPLDLELDNGQTLNNTQLFEFETPRAKIKVWLLPTHHYFPGRVEVYNIKKDKTLTLLLQEPPKI